MIKTHKKTNKRFLLKKDHGNVSSLYALDENDNKILSKDKKGRQLRDTLGEKRYDIAICLNENLI